MKILITLPAVLLLAACSADGAAPPAASPTPRAAAARSPARCGDGPILFETLSSGVGADTSGTTLYSPSRGILREGGAFRVEVGAWSHEGCVSAGEERAFARALAAARFTGGSPSCAKTPHVDVLVRDARAHREVEYQLFSATIDDPCGPLPDASVIGLGRMFSAMTAKNAPPMPA